MKLKLRGERDYKLTFLQQVLRNRGVQDLENFFDLDWDCVQEPENLDYIDEGVKLFIKHIENNSTIAVLVDADMDGFSSAAMLINYIHMQQRVGDWKEYHPEIKPLFHSDKMHGLNDMQIMRQIRDEIRPDLLIIPDASGSEDQYNDLAHFNIDILVLDHHDTVIRGNGNNIVVINNQHSPRYTNKAFCGAGVVWQFLRAVDYQLECMCADYFIDLCALANIADDMDLKSNETRFLCHYGLQQEHLRNYFLRWCQVHMYNMNGKEYTPHNIAFYIAPLFNAVCRIGTMEEKEYLFRALIDRDCREMVKDGTRGHTGKVELIQEALRKATNTKARQDRKRNKLTDLIERVIEERGMAHDKVLVLAFNDFEEDWRALTGVTAQQISQTYQRPCILAFLDKNGHTYFGSLRANDNIEAYQNFKDQCNESGLCNFVAGHQQAAGLSIEKENVPRLIEYFNKRYESISTEPCYYVDFIVDADDPKIPDIIQELAGQEHLWGTGLVEPKVAITGVRVDKSTLSLLGAKKSTLCIKHPFFKLLTFKSSQEEYNALLLGSDYDRYRTVTVIGVSPEMNEFNRKVTPQFFIEDYAVEGMVFDF